MSTPNVAPVHDTTPRVPQPGIALCLSGGGYRAMVFHIGVLWRLNEAGMLGRLNRISSVSGGSITAGVLGMNWDALGVQPGKASPAFYDLVVKPLRRVASITIDEPSIFGGILLPGSISHFVAAHYDKHLFEERTLQDLPDDKDPTRPAPRFVINATNVQSGVLMRFSRRYMADFRVGRIDKPRLALSKAVAASSAFPPVLSPCEIDVADCGAPFAPPDGTQDLSFPPYTTKLVLTDGGVYDNLGLETAFKRYGTIFASDAGGHYKPETAPHHDWARHALRVLDLVDSQVRALRARQLVALFQAKVRQGALWTIRQDMAIYPARAANLPCPFNRTTDLANYPTRLQEMDDEFQERLINWGYAVSDAALRSYFDPTLPPPSGFPYSRGV